MASGTLEKCCLYRWILVYTVSGSMASRVWTSGLLMPTLWIGCAMVEVELWYGLAKATDNERRCVLLMAAWLHRDAVTKSWDLLSYHSSAAMTSCCSMMKQGPDLYRSLHNLWKLKTSQFFCGLHIHQTCDPLSMWHFLPRSRDLTQPLRRSGPKFYRSQSTTSSSTVLRVTFVNTIAHD